MPRRNAILAHDPTVDILCHRPDDRFAPFHSAELAEVLARDVSQFGPQAAGLVSVAAAIRDVIEQEASAFETQLDDRYAAFNPDRDTIPLIDVAKARTPAGYTELKTRIDYLLGKANFERLTDVQIEAALRAAGAAGLRVRLDPDRVERLGIWVRGLTEIERWRRTWRHPLKGAARRLAVYRRLVVVVRLRDDPNVLIKMFKEIPIEEIEALLPHARVQMSWLDRIKVMGGAGGLAGPTAMKLVTGAAALTNLLWIITGGAALVVFRTFMGYRNVRARRDLQRTTNLYFQNLGNNAGAIHSLVAMVAQEEAKEAFLAYAFCHAGTPPVASAADLATRVEAYLAENLGTRFTFDAVDALESLDSMNLWSRRERFEVVPPADAVERLQRQWHAGRLRGYHESNVHVAAGPSPSRT